MKETTDSLLAKVEEAKHLVSIGGRYKHYKGNYYQVIDIAIMEEDTEPCVIYEAEYAKGLSFIRPLKNWLEEVSIGGQKLPRFKEVK